jgi:hypothetical protein
MLEILKNFGGMLEVISATALDTQKAVRAIPGTTAQPVDSSEPGSLPGDWVLALIDLGTTDSTIAAVRDGQLTVTATEQSTGHAKSVRIDTAGHHRINLDATRTNLATLFASQDAQTAETNVGTLAAFDDDDDDDFIELLFYLED